MAPGFHFWVLVCWSVVTMAEGQDTLTPPAGSQNNANPTDCQIFTLTPPPPTRKPVTRLFLQPNTRTPLWTWLYFPQRRPTFYPRLPNRPFLLPNNHGFQFWPFYPPGGGLVPGRYFPRGQSQSESSSEESSEE